MTLVALTQKLLIPGIVFTFMDSSKEAAKEKYGDEPLIYLGRNKDDTLICNILGKDIEYDIPKNDVLEKTIILNYIDNDADFTGYVLTCKVIDTRGKQKCKSQYF